jgi:quercetin dioxygenase-like cupin family protein
MSTPKKPTAYITDCVETEVMPGVIRTTLAYIDEAMICHFRLREDTVIPIHNHAAVQAGYVISGKIHFTREDGSEFIAEPGCGYAFSPNEKHGACILENTVVIEFFTPSRPDYIDE